MNQPTTTTTKPNGESTLHELFALSDEQLLEIDAQPEVAGGQANRPSSSVVAQHAAPLQQRNASDTNHDAAQPSAPAGVPFDAAQGKPETPEPPPWLAAQMKDPWSGDEAREFWNGVQQAKTEAAAYRQAIASPEDARALKELYPGGITEARSAAERSRLLDEIDRAYFGAAGATPEQLGASRAQLAQQMLREDPAAFREMVIAGLRALEEAGQGSGAAASPHLPRLAQILTSSAGNVRASQPAGAQHAAPLQGSASRAAAVHESPVTSHESLSAYAAFERAANGDLERSVGAAIDRTLEQALPGVARNQTPGQAGAQHAVPLQQKLSAAIRQDIEKALQGDRQLGEQVAQILASRRFDNDIRAQVVRLINERAQQLVPGAAKRVLNDWTQAALAAHRTRTQREDSAAARADLAPAENRSAVPQARQASPALARRDNLNRASGRNQSTAASPRRVDYRRFTDEQILDMS